MTDLSDIRSRLHLVGKADKPREVIPLPLARTSPRSAPALPAVPLTALGNDALRKLARDVVAEEMRRARATHNAWDGPRLTLDEVISWLGGETYDARIEKTSKTIGLSVLPIAREAEEGAP